jgi:hypothetical protein
MVSWVNYSIFFCRGYFWGLFWIICPNFRPSGTNVSKEICAKMVSYKVISFKINKIQIRRKCLSTVTVKSIEKKKQYLVFIIN